MNLERDTGKGVIDIIAIQAIIPKPNKLGHGFRAMVVGTTGSGKSEVTKALTEYVPVKRVLLLDPKGDLFYPGAILTNDPKMIPVLFSRGYDIVQFRPPFGEENTDLWEVVLRWALMEGNILIVIDELTLLSDNGYTYPVSLKSIYTQGRALGISVIACMQRPAGVPKVCRDMCDWFYIFTVGGAQDRKALAEELGPTIEVQIPLFWFWFSHNRALPVKHKLLLEE